VTIFGTGPLLYKCLEVAQDLVGNEQEKAGSGQVVNCEVINVSTLKPLDAASVIISAKKTGAVVTVEEHQITGGLFGAISECLSANFPVPIEAVGMPNQFGESGKPEELLEKYGMGKEAIRSAVLKVIKRKAFKSAYA
jgi:transketolase